MDNDIKLSLDRLSELSNEEIEALSEAILTQFDSVESAGEFSEDSVNHMTELADAHDAVQAEARTREAQAEELAAKAAEATTRIREAAGKAEVIEDEETDEVVEEETPVAEETEDEEPEAVQASGAEDEAPAAEEAPAEEFASEETEAATAVPVPDDEDKDDTDPAADETPVPSEEVAPTDQKEKDEESTFATDEAPAESTTPEADSEFAATPDEQPEAEDTPTPTEEEFAVSTANDGAIEAPADRRPIVTPEETAVPVAITAGADIPGVSAGAAVENIADVSRLMEKRLHSLRNVTGGDGEQHVVSTFSTEYPTERFLGGNAVQTMERIEKVAGPEAIVAAGGFATPLPVNYDVFGLGSLSRPIRDSLPKFQADRGGIRFIEPPQLADYEDAVGVWTNAMDTTPGSNTKAVLTVNGAAERTAELDAITLQLQVGNLFSRAYPELLARHNELALIQHARLAERTLVAKIDAASTQVTAGKVLGFARDFLVQIRRAAAAYRSHHRIDPRTQLRGIIPSWVVDAVAADLTMQMPGDDVLSESLTEINRLLTDSGVTLTESPDISLFPAQAAGALTPFPASFEWYLFAEGTFVFLDGGTLDLGVIRDSTLVSTNDYRMFVETFEGLAYVGIESYAITSTIAVTGEAAALVDTTP